MNDTSLISSQETPTAQTNEGGADDANTNVNNAAPGEGGDAQTAAEKMYPTTAKQDEPGESKEELTEEQKAAKAAEEAKDGEGDEELTEEQKAAKEAADKEAEEAEKAKEKKDDKDENKGEPLDLSDIEVDLPEGMELNQEAMSTLSEVSGELGLDKEGATKLIPIGVKLVEAAIEKQQADYTETRKTWRDEVAADPEIGGADDTARSANLAIANKGLQAYGSPELRTLLNQTGLGDHKEVIRVFHKLGKMVGDDVVESGGSGDTGPKPLDKMYPSMTKK